MKKALIITGKLVQDHEFIYPYYRLKEDGFEVDVATKNGKEVLGAIGVKVPATKSYEDIRIDDYNLLIIPGGAKCMEYLRQEQGALDFINQWNSKGKIIASICHGAQLLISAKIIKGRRVSGYYSIKDDIINAGAEYVDAPFVTDGNLVTSPHYKHLGDWMKETLRLFKEKK
ncbi:type 1 glutamine amidotransferase [bacterium]|nr:MAG: type 1 glutamine amidotransferase [bacterium]